MSLRLKVWSLGLVATVFLLGLLGWNDGTRELMIPASLVAVAVCALFSEVIAFWSLSRTRNPPSIPIGARPADGLVEMVPISGTIGTPNPGNPAYQRFVELSPEPSSATTTNISSPPMLGRVALVSVFVGPDGVPWSDLEVESAHEALERAGSWIEREAIRRGAPVNVALSNVYFSVTDEDADLVEVEFSPEGGEVGPMEANAAAKAVTMASRAALKLGFADVADWMSRINARIDADAKVWLFHIRRAGRSIAITLDISGVPGVAFAVCYAKEASFPEPLKGRARVDPTTVAHELLHLFGASDKYGVALGSYPEGSVSSREIMRLNHDSLFRMTIDSHTAVEIGWSSTVNQNSPKKNNYASNG